MLTRSPLDSGRRCKRGARNSERVPSVGAKSYRTPKTARQPLGAHAGTASGDICVTRCASVADSFPACMNISADLANDTGPKSHHNCNRVLAACAD